jgi:hypothetical protein
MDRSSRFEPTAQLKTSFDKMLQVEMATTKEAKVVKFQPVFYRVAAAITLLLVGVALGFWINKYQQQEERLTQIANELNATKQLMMSMLDNEQSPGQRILGVKAAYASPKPDTDVVDALINLMNEDPNSNVRLAAVDALKKFYEDKTVRKALIGSLSKQTDPSVQIALIQLLVEMKEKDALKPLQHIIDDEEILPAVKDEAHAGIFKLS